MKTKTIFLIILPILLIVCSKCLNAQMINSSDSLIGEWEYLVTGDTITLIKHNIDKKDYTKWIIKANNEFIEQSSVSGDDKHYGIGTKSVGVKWYYDTESKILKIDRGRRLNKYKLVLFDRNIIKLIKI